MIIMIMIMMMVILIIIIIIIMITGDIHRATPHPPPSSRRGSTREPKTAHKAPLQVPFLIFI